MTRGNRIVRNAGALMASQPITWTLTLIFTVMVPRNVGPSAWGEWAIAWAVGGLTKAVLDFGINTVLFKRMSRDADDAERILGAVLTLRLVLTPVLVLGMVGFSLVAGYNQHTRLIVGLVAVTVAVGYITTPLLTGLQAVERMHVTAAIGVFSGMILTAGALLLLKSLALGIVSISLVALMSSAIGLVLQTAFLRRVVSIRPRLDWPLMGRLLREALPYWATLGFFTLYVWLDGILLSLIGSTKENGWYGVAGQVISTLGFLPYAVTTAVFPALSRTIHVDKEESAQLAARSFRLLVTLSLPMSIGLALVAQNAVITIYGRWFEPASQALTVLALTLPPVYVATLVNAFVIAADKQVQWTWVMGTVSALNLILNLVTIPYFHHNFDNGALGAAMALLGTDLATGVAALILLPTSFRSSVMKTAPAILAAAAATMLMAAAVWPLRGLFLPIPILTGLVVFTTAALLFRAFPNDEVQLLLGLMRRFGRRPLALGGRPNPDVVADTEVA